MSGLFDTGKPEKIDLPDGEWVKLRTCLSYEEIEKLEGYREELIAAGEKNVTSKASYNSIKMVLIEWSAKDADGKPLPINEENLKKMRSDYFQFIGDKVLDVLEKKYKDTSDKKK